MTSSPANAPNQVPAEYKAPKWNYVACLIIGAVAIVTMSGAGSNGSWWLPALFGTVTTYGAWAFGRLAIDDVPIKEAFRPATQSWAMLLIGLPVASVVFASAAWSGLSTHGWYTFGAGWGWIAVGYVAGVAFYMVRRLWLDHPNFNHGAEVLLYTPSKLVIDYIAYFVVPATIVTLVVPIAFSGLWAHSALPLLSVLSLVAWAVIGVGHDAKGGLDVWNLHTAYNSRIHEADPGYRARLR